MRCRRIPQWFEPRRIPPIPFIICAYEAPSENDLQSARCLAPSRGCVQSMLMGPRAISICENRTVRSGAGRDRPLLYSALNPLAIPYCCIAAVGAAPLQPRRCPARLPRATADRRPYDPPWPKPVRQRMPPPCVIGRYSSGGQEKDAGEKTQAREGAVRRFRFGINMQTNIPAVRSIQNGTDTTSAGLMVTFSTSWRSIFVQKSG